jgi:hypothetical protein
MRMLSARIRSLPVCLACAQSSEHARKEVKIFNNFKVPKTANITKIANKWSHKRHGKKIFWAQTLKKILLKIRLSIHVRNFESKPVFVKRNMGVYMINL